MPENPMEMLFGGGGESGPAYQSAQIPMVEDVLMSMIFGQMNPSQLKALSGSNTGFGKYLESKWGANDPSKLSAMKINTPQIQPGSSGYNMLAGGGMGMPQMGQGMGNMGMQPQGFGQARPPMGMPQGQRQPFNPQSLLK